jgi:thiamine-monophosphate kinase
MSKECMSMECISIERDLPFMASISNGGNDSHVITVRSLGEFSVIERLRDIAAQGARNSSIPEPLVGSGDDSAVVAFGSANVAMSIDMFVEERHFRTDWSSAVDIGRRCAAAAMSDICAMGIQPSNLLVGIGAPPETAFTWIKELFSGLVEEASIAGAQVVGGDLVSANSIFISVTVLGHSTASEPLTRSGAREGDIIAVHGALGRAGAGLRVLQRGLRSPRSLVDSFRFPQVDYLAGVRAREAGARAMIDVSDGLIADLRHMATASRVTIDIQTNLLSIPDDLKSAASAFGVDPLAWVLEGGDDHALVAAFPSQSKLPDGFTQIGNVVAEESESVKVDGVASSSPGGYIHFSE